MANNPTLYINYTMFGETRRVLALKHNMRDDEIVYDEVLWVERPEDFYALSSQQLKNKRVVIVTRDDWMRARPFEIIEDLVYRLRKRAEIRRQITTRKSVQEGKPDRIADLLEEAANEIDRLREIEWMYNELQK